MPIKKFKDWRGWFEGLRKNIFKCIGTTGTSWLGSNGLEQVGIHGIGLNLEQAGGLFVVHILFEIFSYLKDKPDADVIEVSTETEIVSKSDMGK